ncbi:gliding motility-associated C-terminal domain-containing protein [Algibacter sp. L3A6]|uniref:gliding motility-associated C-terminal domain-containing protein n=1 Tax=Algibacter sp. L3A6 TaxID=2686366 RepID=UPI00131AC6CD|nr:gliding motility-associated C-terminal domain-containing protein [Algibacter sp. L3A6]
MKSCIPTSQKVKTFYCFVFLLFAFSQFTSAQCIAVDDCDGDGILNVDDLDDDNDGILDSVECIDESGFINITPDVLRTYSSAFSVASGSGRVLNYSESDIDISAEFGLPVGSIILDVSNISENSAQNFWATDVTDPVNNGAYPNFTFSGTKALYFRALHGPSIPTGMAYDGIISDGTLYDQTTALEAQYIEDNSVPNEFRIQRTTSTGDTNNSFGFFEWNSLSTTSSITFTTTNDTPTGVTSRYDLYVVPQIDSDGDGIGDCFDEDSDGDGCYDALEGGDNISVGAVDGSGMLTGTVDGTTGVPNDVDVNNGQTTGTSTDNTAYDSFGQCDADDDGVLDANDVCNGFDDNANADGDTVPDACDLDDDNDGITDTNEGLDISSFDLNNLNGVNSGTTANKSQTATCLAGSINIGTKQLTFDAGWNNAGSGVDTEAILDISVNGVKYFSMETPSDGSHVTDNATEFGGDAILTTFNGATLVNSNPSSQGSNYIDYSGFGTTSTTITLHLPAYVVDPFVELNFAALTEEDDITIQNAALLLACALDTDNDGIADYLDTDSDNDGCPDALEGGDNITVGAVDENGMLTGTVDGTTGVPNDVDVNNGQTTGTSTDNTAYDSFGQCDADDDGVLDANDVCNGFDDTADNDSDGVPDGCDLDDDNDGISDTVECDITSYSVNFDLDNEGWIIDNNNLDGNDGNTVHSTAALTNSNCDYSIIPASPSNTDYILWTDVTAGNVYFENATDLNLDLSDLTNNGTLSFNWINGVYGGTTPTSSDMIIVLNGGGKSVTYPLTGVVGSLINTGTWHAISVDLTTTNFGVDLTDVLADLDVISIKVENINNRQVGDSGTVCSDAEYMALDDLVLTSLCIDTDGDGTPNYLDLDSDADGCSDANEAYNNIDADDNDTGVYGPDTPTLANGGVDANGLVVLAGVTGNAYNTIPTTTAGGLNTFEEGMTLAIDTAPSNEIKCETETAQFDAVASAAPVGTNTPVATASTDVTYQWSVSTDGINYSNLASETGTVPSGTTVSLELTNVTNAMDGNIYRVVFTNEANICFAEAEATLTVNPSDDASFNYTAAAFCVSDSDPTPTITGLAGGTFSSAAGLSINGSTGVIDVSASTPATYTVTYTTAGTCPNSSTASVTINALDDAGFNYAAAAYCVDATDPTPTITGLSGGTFSSGAGLSINASTGVIDVSASTPATYTVTYTTAGTCPNSSTASLTINALDDASFSYAAAAYCADATDPTPTITGLAGGTFSSAAGLSINASTGVIDVSASTPATYTITYTAAGTCPNSSTASITINALDDASFSYAAAAYCVDATDPTPTITGLSGGTFSSGAGLSINGSTGVIDVSASTPATYTVTYTTAGTCPNSSTASVTINALDDASFSYAAAAYCADATDPTPTITGLAGGTFSSGAGLSINASTGVIDVSASTPATYTVTYTTAGTCPNSSTASVTINALDDASFNYDSAAYCADTTDPTPTISGLAGGTFSSAAGLSINASTGVIDVSASTPATYTVTYTTAGTCSNSSDVSVTINDVPNAPAITGDGLLCNTETTTLSTTATGTIVWSSDAPGVASIDSNTGEVTAVSAGTTNITYTVSDGNGCSTESSAFTIIVSCIDAIINDFTATPVDGVAGGTAGDVTANDTLNGAAVDDTLINITLDNDGGLTGVTIDASGNVIVPAGADSGNYTLTYTICEIAVPSNCDTTTVDIVVDGTIDAVINDFTATPVDGVVGGTAGDVTANDTLNGAAVDDTLINITLDNDGGLTGVTIDATGNVIVPAGADSGNYTLTYTICEIAVPSNCDTSTVEIVVDGTIDAVINDFTAVPVDGVVGGTAGDVTANDTLNGAAVDDTLINITLDNDGGLTGVTIDATGNVIVPAGADSGNYTLTYTICEIAVPSNCDTTTVEIVVDGTIDAVINDFTATPVDGVVGGTAGDVTANDSLNGAAVDDTLINITLDNDGGLTGVTIDATGNVIVPAGADSGNYTLTYTICEIAVPSNCDTTTVEIVVDGTIDAVVNDFTATPIDGVAGGTAGDVTANDTLNGTAVDDTEITITLDDDGGLTGVTIDATGNVIVPAGSESGNYTLTYTICEIAVPSNCDTTTVEIVVDGTIDAVINDFTATPVDGVAGGTAGDVTANDTLNGTAVDDTEITITLDDDGGLTGVTIDATGNVIVPAGADSGNYTLTYTICEIAVPSNCDTTTVEIVVDGTIDAVINDFTAVPVDGVVGGTAGDVTANDTLNGAAVDDTLINITLDNDGGLTGVTIDASGNVIVPAGADSGNYTLTYTICEIAVPSNCDTTTVEIVVDGTIDAVVNDFTATPVDGVVGGTAGDVTANDTLNGAAVDDTLINITLDNDGGLIGVTIDANGNVIVPAGADSGNYTLTYTICEIAVPSNCDTTTVEIVVDGTIDAVVNDFTAAPIDGVAGGTAGDVTANDTLNGVAVDDTLINITLDNDGGLIGVTIDANGNVIVPAGADSGNYTLTYTICEIAVPSNCDTTTVEIVVDGTIDAVINDFTAVPVDGVVGGIAGDVTANDTLNGAAVDDTLINITLDNDGGLTGVTIDASGNVIVPAGADSGNYTLTYTICEIAVPSNCDTTTVEIVVDGTIDAVVNDFTAAPIDGVAGGTAGDVTANDTLNGAAVDDTEITIILDNDGGLTGVTIDASGNVIVPAGADSGNYTLTYTICEIAVPSNCDTTTVEIVVNGTIDAVINDFTAVPVDGVVGGSAGDVTANDTLNGAAVDDTLINITLDNDGGLTGVTIDASGNVIVPAGADSGNYTLTYTICEIAVPSNCDTTTVDIVVDGTIDAVINDFTAVPVDGVVGGIAGDVTANDTLNGAAVDDTLINIILDNDGGLTGVTIDASGNVIVPAGADSGNYTLTYTICEIAVPSNCDTTTVEIVVDGTIDAVVNDFTAAPIDGVAGGTAGDVTANDTLNGAAVDDTLINITLDNDGGLTGVTIDANGNVIVPAGSESGNYTLTYTICEIAVPSNCDNTTVDIVVDGTIDAVINDFTAVPVDGVAGGTAGDVTANDTLNGAAVDDTLINITLDNDGGLTGVTIDANGNVIVPAGSESGNYTLTYTICEIAVPSNCDTTTVDIEVGGTINAVVNDFTATPINGKTGGTAGDVTANDTLNGVAVDDSEINITLDNNGGLVGVSIDANGNVIVPEGTTSGTYTITYTICEIAVLTNCDTTTAIIVVETAVIDAIIDDFSVTPINGYDGGIVGDVTLNDTLDGVVVTDSQITITLDNNGGLVGASISATGEVNVPAGTPAGSYVLTYTICENLNPSNCDTTTVTVVVEPATIEATNDDFTSNPINGLEGGIAGDVTLNDTLNGDPVDDGNIFITDNGGIPSASIDADGNLIIPPNTPEGTYTIEYTICENLNPTNCDSANVTVLVSTAIIDAVNNDFTATSFNGLDGGTTTSVYTNDTLNNDPFINTAVTSSIVNDGGLAGVTINNDGTINVPENSIGGTYNVEYQICEVLNTSNCDTAIAIIVVDLPIIDAIVDDFTASPVNGTNGGAVGNVLGNDTLNGDPITSSEVNVTLTSDGGLTGVTIGANGVVEVPAGTSAGTYTITYQICDVINPTNCDTATAILEVGAGTIDAINDDFTALPINGSDGGAPGNILLNDTLASNAVIASEVTIAIINDGGLTGITIDANGDITVPVGTAAGTYSVIYQICENINSGNCDNAVISIVVEAPIIEAVNDDFTAAPVNGLTGGVTASVFGDDTINTNSFANNDVVVSLTDTAGVNGATINTDGTINVPANTPAGTYVLEYQICEVLNPSNCDTATVIIVVGAAIIDAISDDFSTTTIDGETGGTAGDVTLNDTLNGVLVDNNSIDITLDDNGGLIGVAINNDGSIIVPPSSTSGTYTITYTICENLNPTNCDTTTAIVVVGVGIIDAVVDDFTATPISGIDGGVAGDVTLNDTLNGNPVIDANISITLNDNDGLIGASIDINGLVNVPAGTPAGSYDITYTICENLNPTNCDTTTVTVIVESAVIDAIVDDFSTTPINGTTGGNVGDVTSNDILNGDPVLDTDITITLDSNDGLNGVSIDASGNIIVPSGSMAGTYVVSYTICENLNPSNCNTSTVTIIVEATPIDAIEDNYTATEAEGIAGITYSDILTNDTLNGIAVDVNDISVTPNTNGPLTVNADGSVDVAPNTTPGTYTVTYTICEVAVPGNCDTATVTITVNAATCTSSIDTDGDGFTDCEETTGIDDPSTEAIPTGISDETDPCSPISTGCVAEITVTKIADVAGTNLGEQISYSIYVENTGDYDLTEIALIDTFLDANDETLTLTSEPTFDGADLGSLEGSLLIGEIATYIATFTINEQALNAGSVSNSVSVSGKTANNQIVADISDDGDDFDGDLEEDATVTELGCVSVINEFSPNGDGLGDTLVINCIDNYPNNSLEVYNRWGNIVYKKKSYSSTNEWDGTSDGRSTLLQSEKLPVGTYYYVLDLGNGSKPMVGWLYINR